jgi:hypothetical protein
MARPRRCGRGGEPFVGGRRSTRPSSALTYHEARAGDKVIGRMLEIFRALDPTLTIGQLES